MVKLIIYKNRIKIAALYIIFFMVWECYAAKPSPDIFLSNHVTFYVKKNVVTGIDFVINNNSSYDLKGIYIVLTGKVEGNSVTFIDADPGTALADSSLGFPNNGMNVSAPPNAAITDIKLTFSTAFGGIVHIKAAIDNATPPPVNVNAYFSCYCYPDFGSIHTWNYTPGSSIPSSGRRMLTVTITNESDT